MKKMLSSVFHKYSNRAASLSVSALIVAGFQSSAADPTDRLSTFDSDLSGWAATDSSAALTWSATGGFPGGCLTGKRATSGTPWYLRAPTDWSGDWSGYKVLKFDLSIPSRHYPDLPQDGMVVIVGANGEQMSWVSSTPLWTWTHYEVSLTPEAFGVTDIAFQSIIQNVAEVWVLAEFVSVSETVALDNVLVTAAPPQSHSTNLESFFSDGTIQGWRPVDDVTLTTRAVGLPGYALYADDWQDGRLYKIATPLEWAGDWRGFSELSFDMKWTGAGGPHANEELVRIFGANGKTLSWSNTVAATGWTQRILSLTPATFNVSQAEFDSVMAHVSEMWIFGEFDSGDDITTLDNIVLKVLGWTGPPVHTSLISRFDSGREGWNGYDGVDLSWTNTFGFAGGGIRGLDKGAGVGRFQTPDSWAGDWRAFKFLKFMLNAELAQRSTYPLTVNISKLRGTNLTVTLPSPYNSWTPYTLELSPLTFGTSQEQYDDVMSDVACMWITAESSSTSGENTRLDNVMLLLSNDPGLPPDRESTFDTDAQGWRRGEWRPASLAFEIDAPATHVAAGGNPGGFIRGTDTGDWTYWFSPENWAGDLRGLQNVSLDFKIISGTALFDTKMLSIVSPWTNLHAHVTETPPLAQWKRYDFALTPETFGISQDVFDKAIRDCVAIAIRSEWITGAEEEGLDNVRASGTGGAFWTWMAQFFTAAELTDEAVTGWRANPDGDTADNWSEFIANTNPTNQLDVLRFDYTREPFPGVFEFQSRTGRFYSIEGTASLNTPWQTVTNDIPGTDSLIRVANTNTAGIGFYRLRVRN